MAEEPIYITGSGIVSAIGNNKAETLSSLLAMRTGIGRMRHLESEHTELPVGEVKMSDAQMRQALSLPPDAPANRTALMGIIAMKEALKEAGATPAAEGVTLLSGTTVGGMEQTERCFLHLMTGDDKLRVLATHDCGATTRLQADYFGIPSSRVITISTACSSAANAIAVGANLIKTGQADMVVAGGSEAITKFHLNGFNSLMILDSDICRPFDAERKGLNLGEGAAYVVMESAESAARRGARPICELRGYGNACDAYHQTASSPDGEGAYRAMKEALLMSGLSAADIQYINAHGTGTPNNDVSESNALRRVFGENIPKTSSTKSFTGHTTSASGAVETVICILALTNGFLPANLGWEHQMPDGLTPTLGESGIRLKNVMCNSFGFGGNDTSLVLSQYGGELKPAPRKPLRPVYLHAVCRHSPSDGLPDIRKYIPPMEARRMCGLLKSALATSLSAMEKAGIDKPGGIFIGTKYGMLSNSEKFLYQMCHEGEHSLGPTLFMQSTHNTIAGTLGARLKCHGYNITFSQGDNSLDCALRDAAMQIAMGRIDSALVGSHDESTPLFSDMFRRFTGTDIPIGEYSVSMVLTCEAEGAMEKINIP